MLTPAQVQNQLTGAQLSRRDALRLSGVSIAGLVAAGYLSGCANSGSAPSNTASAPASKKLATFVPSSATGPKTGLPKRVAWASTADTQIFEAFGDGISEAASKRGFGYLTAQANGDAQENVRDLETFLGRGVGGLVVQPLDQTAQSPVLTHAIDQGVCVEGIITYPTSLQIAARQYDIGYDQGLAAVEYARAHLNGRVDVAYFNQDATSDQLALRHHGTLAALKTGGPGIRVVSDYSPGQNLTIELGFGAMLSVIEQHPTIKMVLGCDDTPIVGAYRALDQVGKLTPDMYLSGVDGDSNALALIKEGTPYRASFAFPWQIMGYAMGQFAADWVEGRDIPRVVIANTSRLDSAAAVNRYLSDNAHAAAVFESPARLAPYLPMLGNTNYANRRLVWEQDYVP